MQDANLGRANRAIKRITYAAVAFAGFVMWSYYSGIGTLCACSEGFVCNCTNYAIEAAETAGIVLAISGTAMFGLSFFKIKLGAVSRVE